MPIRRNLFAAGLAAGLVLPAFGQAPADPPQKGNPAGMSAESLGALPDRVDPARHVTNNVDQLFVRLIASGGMAEVIAGELAGERAETGSVGDFARTIVADHGKANEELAALAAEHDIQMPESLTGDDRKMLARLMDRRGRAFEIEYAAGQVVAHQKAAQLLEWQIAKGQDDHLRAYAERQLPTIMGHLAAARALLEALRAPEG